MKKKSFKSISTQECSFYIDHTQDFTGLKELDISRYDRCVVILDKNLSSEHTDLIFKTLNNNHKELIIIELEPDEKNKGISQSIKIIEELEKNTVGRHDLLISVGGGFVSDLVSFVASIYMRGIPFIAIPTTLIGQVDAVTAGKTCINGPQTKNLLGTFYFPLYVYNNISFLVNLPQREMRQGWSEIFKYALLDSKKLLTLMESYFKDPGSDTLVNIIEETIRVRLKIREVDPLSSNLGHTFGHAFEKLSNYRISHGDAIAIGTLLAVSFGEEIKISRSGLHDEILALMNNFSLNTRLSPDFDVQKVSSLMLKDKKSSSKSINLVLLKDIGQPYYGESNLFYSVDENVMTEFIGNYFIKHSDRIDKDLFKILS